MVDNTARSMQRGPSFTNPGLDMAAIEQVRGRMFFRTIVCVKYNFCTGRRYDDDEAGRACRARRAAIKLRACPDG